MNHRKKLLVIMVMVVIALLTGLIGHSYSLDERFGAPLIFFSVLLIFFIAILFFLQEQVFYAWKKFAIIYVPISIILIAIASPTGDMFFPSSKETLTFLLPIIFIIASLYIMISKSLKLRRK